MVGTTLNHYKILSKIGSGGMGDVYLAEDGKLNRRVALKILPPDLAEKPERRERFEREAQAVAALNHPNIVTIHSVEEATGIEGREGAVHFLTMELVQGQTLDEAIPKKGLKLDRFFDIAIPVADAISAAHGKGITHRDLKPANIMISEDGRVKVLDFGLARFDEGPLETAATKASERLTGEGQILGTTAYMSPEQAEGKLADHRSDIFSLGVILYEMATGERPFKGDTQISMITSILRDTPTSITEVKRTYPRHLGRIIGHSLEKDPGRRYQSTIDLRNDLEGLKEEVDSGESLASGISGTGSMVAAGKVRARGWLGYAAAAVVVLVALAGSVWGYRQFFVDSPRELEPAGVGAADVRPSLAVLYFDNISGEEEIDWLRTGLTEMLVTDLSQSPDLRVLGTDRVYEILDEMGRLDEPATSSAVVRAVAERTEVESVVLGSFMQAGDTIRITARLQNAISGEVLASEQVEGEGEASIFSMVDELTRRLRTRLALAPPTSAMLDRELGEVTTSSIEAYRYFVEANRLHESGSMFAAIPLFERALEIDPGFALALAKLSIVYGNLFEMERSFTYAERALEHVDRLTLRERYYIEGAYYSSRPATELQSVEAYKRLVDLYPDFTPARNNLASAYSELGRYDEAISLLEGLVEIRDNFQGVYGNLANVYAYLGDLDKARESLELMVSFFPDNSAGYRNLGFLLVRIGEFDRAEAVLARATAMAAGDPLVTAAIAEMRLLRGDYAGAQEAAGGLLALPIPATQAYGTSFKVSTLLYQGRLTEAVATSEHLAAASSSGTFRAMALRELSHLALEGGDPARALELADAAAQATEGFAGELSARALAAIARQRLGRASEASSSMAEIVARLGELPTHRARVNEHLYPGLLALERGEIQAAIAELRAAESQLTASANLYGPPVSSHAAVWFALGSAFLESGEDSAATERFQRIVDSYTERTLDPLPYVRSLYFLGKIRLQRGDTAQARDYLQRFIDHWGDGEMDRERVAEARELLATL